MATHAKAIFFPEISAVTVIENAMINTAISLSCSVLVISGSFYKYSIL